MINTMYLPNLSFCVSFFSLSMKYDHTEKKYVLEIIVKLFF